MSKTITRKSDNVSVYLLHNDATVDLAATPNATVRGNTGGRVNFDIGDLNSSTATLYEDIEAPENWKGNRYIFNGSTWTEVEGWVDHKVAQIARLQEEIDALNAE